MYHIDWNQLSEIAFSPDNIPILVLMVLVPFYTFYGLKQAFANDRLIAQLEADPELARTHHRKVQPYQEGWPKVVHVWPYLLKIEFLAALVVTVILIVWAVTVNAPLEEPANPNLTMNPAKAPWYFLGLQEMLVYFDPWIAGVVLPGLIIGGLIMIPYCDVNPLGNGYYTFKQRKYAILTFVFGFHILWLLMTIIGVFIRGPQWMWFWPGMYWDHHRVIHETNQNLSQLVGLDHTTAPLAAGLFGAGVLAVYGVVMFVVIHKLYTKYKRNEYNAMNIYQYMIMQFFLISMVALPIKIALRLLFRIKYVLVTPWFNV
ncbi:MAG: cytochrome C [Planctomycetota bacterium]